MNELDARKKVQELLRKAFGDDDRAGILAADIVYAFEVWMYQAVSSCVTQVLMSKKKKE